MDMFHVYYKYSTHIKYDRHAFSIHIDDIEGVFGLRVLNGCKELNKGERMYISIEATLDE
jgi:hypothetical protein